MVYRVTGTVRRGSGVGLLLLAAAHLGLLWIFDLAAHPAATVSLVLVGFLGLLVVWRSRAEFGSGSVLAVAAVLRLLLLPLPVTLSDDALRYLWDGRVAAAGMNPYRLAPEAADLAFLRDDLWERLPHRDVPTVYPPLALALFSIAASLPAPLLALKILLSGIDLASCYLCLALARRLGLRPARAIWYAWSPLVTLEVAGMAHVDALGVLAILATVLCLTARPVRPIAAGLGAAAGVLAKLVPVVALPTWARGSGRAASFLLCTIAAVAVALAPVLGASGGVPPGLLAYGISWEFNGPLYEPLWRLLEASGAPTAIKNLLDSLKLWTGRHEFWNLFYPFVYGRFFARLLLAAGLCAAIVASLRARHPVAASGFIFGSVVLTSATVYPWYLLWVLPWAALCQHPAWLLLSAMIPLSYLSQFLAVPLFPVVFVIIWLPFLAVALWRPRWSID